MNPSPASAPPTRRSYARWIIAGLLLLAAPVVVVGVGIWSLLTLDREAAALRHDVMKATGSNWHTRVQVSPGWATLTTARTILHFVHHENIREAQLALAAVRHASVGVYERDDDDTATDTAQLLAEADQTMRRRGWSRLVGVVEGRQTVMVYTSDDAPQGDRIDLCVAVIDRKELVVVSTRVDAAMLAKLVELHHPDRLARSLRFARFDF